MAFQVLTAAVFAAQAIGTATSAVLTAAAAAGTAGLAAAASLASIAYTSYATKKAEADARKNAAQAPRDITVRSATEPAKIIYGTARTSGPVVYTNTAPTPGTNDNNTLWTVISLCNHEVEDITDIWLDGDEITASQINWGGTGGVTSGKYGPIGSNEVTNFYKRLGTSTQSHVSELATAFTDWTSSYQGKNVAYIVSAFELGTATGEGVWAQGAPTNIRAVVKGKKVYDPRKDTTNGGSGAHRLADPTTWEWSNNPALCLADYLFDDRLGLGAEGVTYDDIDWALVIAAANVCDATVSIPGSTTEKRFTCNGALSTGNTYAENIKAILSSMNGQITWSGGKYRIRACAYEVPVYTFTGDDVVGDVQIQPERTRTQRFNTVRGTFVDPESDYVATEFIPYNDSNLQSGRDAGQKLTKDISLPMTNSEYMAERIGYKMVALNDQQLRCIVPMNWKALKVGVGDRIQLSIDELSWSNKVFRVEGWTFDPDSGFNLTLQEDSSSAYADPGVSDYSTRTLAGTVVFADQPVPSPSNLSATAEEEAVFLQWSNPGRASGYDEIIVYASATSAWSGASEIARTRGTSYRHELARNTQRYYWIRAVDVDGETSIRNPNSDTSAITATSGQIDFANLGGATKPEDNATYNTGALADKDTVGEADIDDGAVTIDKFGTGLEPVQVVTSLPGTATAGQMAFLTTDNKLYRYNGTAWTAAVPVGDVTGAGALAALDTITLTYVTDAGDVAALDSISETYIDDNSITTVKINANAVTAAKIQANTITAAQIAANTITANQIAANTITANQIAANTITSNEIAANTITAGEIAAGTITASEIGAGAIVTSKLAVTGRGSALNSDPNCQDSSAWEKFAGNNATFTTITDGEVGNNVMRSAAGTTWYNGSEALALDPAKTYRMTALVRKNATANGTLYIGVAAFTQDGTNIGGDGTQWSYGAASGISGSTSWTRYTMEFGAGTSYTFPSNAVTFKPIVLMNYSGSTGYFEAQDVRIEEKVGADLIVDGSISTNHLSADSITGAVFDASSYLRAGSGDNSAVMSGRSIDEYAFWAGKGFETDGGPSGADAPFRVTRDGKVIMTNFALYSEAGTKLFDSQDGLLALPQTAVAQASGSLVPQVSEELTSGTDTFTVTLSSTQTITANFAYPVGALFYSGTSLTDAQNNVSSAFAVTLEYSTDSGSTWNTFGSTQNFSKVTSGTPTSSQYLVVANSFTVSIIYGATPTTVYVASLQSNRGAIDEGMALVGSTSQSLAAGTYLIRMVFSATGGSGTGAPATNKVREVRLTTSGAGFTVSNGVVSDGVGTSATTGWVLSNFVEKTESDNVTINGTLTLGGDLVVNGTTTTINSTTLTVDDKNIVLNYGAGDTSAGADGAGITIQDAVDASNDSSLTWNATGDYWKFSHDLTIDGSLSTEYLASNQTTTPDTAGDGRGFSFHYMYGDASPKPAGIDHSLLTMAYSAAWQTQIAQDWRNGGRMYIRGQNNGTWSSWAQVWSANDFTNNSSNWNTAYTYSQVGHLPLAGGTITGITNTQRDIRSAGQIRATGWWNDAASTDYSDLGFEIGVSGGKAYALSYNRDTSTYGQMAFEASEFRFNNPIYSTGGSTTAGVIETDDTNQWWIKLADYDVGMYWNTTNNHINLRNSYGDLQYNGNKVWHAGNDGSGSTLDADLLDGVQGSSYLRSDQSDTISGTLSVTGSLNANTNGGLLSLGDSNTGDSAGKAQIYYHASGKTLRFYADHSGTTGVTAYERYNGTAYETVWDSGNDGSGSGLDADKLDSYEYTQFNGVVARYRTTGSATGRIRITLPLATNSARMLKFTISQLSSYQQSTYEISGYLYPTSNNWYLPRCVYTGTTNPDIIVGRDSNGYAYVSIANGNYTGIIVHSVTGGYQGSDSDGYGSWAIAANNGTENSVTVEVHKTWNSRNDGSGSGLDADLLDGIDSSSFLRSDAADTMSASLTLSGNGTELLFTGGNNRIKFNGYRALEGATDGSNLQIGEGYSTSLIQTQAIIDGLTFAKRDIRASGLIRAAGWYNEAADTGYEGMAFEIGTSGTTPYAIAYDRAGGTYGNMRFEANSFRFLRGSITADYNITANGSIYADGNVVVNNNGSGNYYLYLKKAVGGDGHLLFQEGSGLRWQNYASSGSAALNWYSYTAAAPTFQLPDSGGANIKVGGLQIGGVEVINSSRVLQNVTHPTVFINRQNYTGSGISWYSGGYKAWATYMAAATHTNVGPTANITAPSGTLVTSWALRNFIENAGGYGWTFESGTSTGNPSVVAEIRSSDGSARFGGAVTAVGSIYAKGATGTGFAGTSGVAIGGQYPAVSFESSSGYHKWLQYATSDNSLILYNATNGADVFRTWAASQTQQDIAFGTQVTRSWSSANRATFNINGNSSSLLGFHVGGATRGYLYATGSDIQLLSYGEVKLQANASSSYQATLNADGFILEDGLYANGIADRNGDILYPEGGTYKASGSSNVGAIKIRLPVNNSATMMKMRVSVYLYDGNSDGRSFTLEVGGYNFSGGNWYNYFANIIGNTAQDLQFNVRFGHDGTKDCIWIGETTTNWPYVQVVVENVCPGYSNYSQAVWRTGWSVSLDTSLGTVERTITANQIGRHCRGNFTSAGNVTAYASDARLKKNITPITNALEKVKRLRGVEFDWIDECEELGFKPDTKHETGVIAQEVQAVISDAVYPAPFNPDYLTVQKDKIVPVLINAVQELIQEVDSLKAKLKELENGND